MLGRRKANLGTGKSAGLLNLNYNDFLTAFSNTTFFEKFCSLYHGFQFCYTKCPHGYLQELLQRSAEIVDHFCVYNYQAIHDQFGCLAQLDQEVSKQCFNTCTSHHDAVTSLMQNFKQLALNGDSSQAEKYLGDSCEYVICTLHCDVPTIAHICSMETADLVINLTKKSFASMESLALDTGAVSKWPQVCADIKTYALPKIAPQTPPEHNETIIAQSLGVQNVSITKNDANQKSPILMISLMLVKILFVHI
uniref:Chondroitin proteoglycan 4 domain-containing protein n=1 Tax=Acrobeloides nanus TaxID=290746 RepID=A0A914DPC3_9BILA